MASHIHDRQLTLLRTLGDRISHTCFRPSSDASRPSNTGISCEMRFNEDGARTNVSAPSYKTPHFVCCIPLLYGAVRHNRCGLQLAVATVM